MVYLRLNEVEGKYLIIYRKDESGKPILNPEDIGIIKFYRIRGGRAEINFNGENYGVIRLEALEEGELKKIVDEKIKNLESKFIK